MVPAHGLFEVEHGKHREDNKRNYFLDGFELGSAELVGTDAIGWNLKTIFEESNHPTHYDYFEQRDIAVLQMAIPGEGHKNVGDGEQRDGSHGMIRRSFR